MSAWGGVDLTDEVPETSLGSLKIDFDVDQCLIRAENDLEGAKKEAQHALSDSAQNGDDTTVKSILGNHGTAQLVDIDHQDDAGSTALTYACCFGHEDVVSELLRFGAQPNIQDKNEWTALMWAINNNHLEIVKQLLAAGANPKIETSSGRTAFDLPISPDSLTYLYLKANGYLSGTTDSSSSVTDGFYKEAMDPADVDAHFNIELKESAAALGGFGALNGASDPFSGDSELKSFTDQNDLLGTTLLSNGSDEMILEVPVRSTTIDSVREFDWVNFKHSDSFALPKDFVPEFLDIVITNLQPSLQKEQDPVSANAIFLACRYFFYCGNTESFMAISQPLGRRIELAIQNDRNSGDLAFLSYWLANCEIFLYYIRKDQKMCADTQRDLQPTFEMLIQQISDRIQQATHNLLAPLLSPCLLNYNSIPEYGNVKYRDEWKLFKSAGTREDNETLEEVALRHMLPPSYDTLMKNPGPQRLTSVLSSLLLLFRIYSVHPLTQSQIIAKLLYFATSRIFNKIVSSRKYLNRRKAMQIRLNVSVLEDWCRNHNFRPQSIEISGNTIRYKSLVDIGRTYLAPLVQILAWLQTFSGFGTDFTNVISTMQELKALNPKQLLQTSTHYRFETREDPLSKEYKHYLQDLANHYDKVAASVDDPKDDKKNDSKNIEVKRDAESGETTQNETKKSGTKSSENKRDTPEQSTEAEHQSLGKPSNATLTTVALVPSQVETVQSCVLLSFKLARVEDVLLDTTLYLHERVPNLSESEDFWGNEDASGISEVQGSRYLIPHVSVDIRTIVASGLENFEKQSKPEQMSEIHEVAEPVSAIRKPEGFEDLDDLESNSWDRDQLDPIW